MALAGSGGGLCAGIFGMVYQPYLPSDPASEHLDDDRADAGGMRSHPGGRMGGGSEKEKVD